MEITDNQRQLLFIKQLLRNLMLDFCTDIFMELNK
jgi:hypothetical protein